MWRCVHCVHRVPRTVLAGGLEVIQVDHAASPNSMELIQLMELVSQRAWLAASPRHAWHGRARGERRLAEALKRELVWLSPFDP